MDDDGASNKAQRAAAAATATLASLVLSSAKALAVDTATRSLPAAVLLNGSVLKWGVFGAIATTAYCTRLKREPRLKASAVGASAQSPSADAATAPAPAPATSASAFSDDALLLSDLQARMQALADGVDEGESDEAAPGAPADDSTDTWGEGSTAVLERPSAPEPPATPPPEFPPGFPLREMPDDWVADSADEDEPKEAGVGASSEADNIASDEQIEMMKRLFGAS